MVSEQKHTIRQKVFEVLENKSKTHWGRGVEYLLLLLIFFNVTFVVIETLPEFSQYPTSPLFLWFSFFSGGIFFLEYLLRIWTAPLLKSVSGDSFLSRVRFLCSPLMLLDALAICSFFSPFNIRWVRVFRLFRVYQVIRATSYADASDRVLQVIRKNKEELVAVSSIMFLILIFCSTLLYIAEHAVPGTKFTSIPAAIWWGISTLTTIGYGDMVPVTPLGRFFGALSAVVGVGIFALPTALLGASFYHEVARRRERQIQRIGEEVELLHDVALENEEKIDQVLRRQQRKIQDLEKTLEEAQTKMDRIRKAKKALEDRQENK
ncbi:ion transporter [Candidatus Peregrinibacteria bacterium]|nr:MAG: ion transporter [Candidatus Peregrinibacteria bacterium]